MINPAEATEQEIFDYVVEHLAQQKKRAADENGSCFYRQFDDNQNLIGKCAVGCMIPDDQYHETMEDTKASDIINYYFPEWEKHSKFLMDLQYAHDGSRTLESIHAQLKHVAEMHKLNNAKVDLITEWS